jgi:hypothetical protein
MKQPWSSDASWSNFSDGIQANGVEASVTSSAVAGNAAGTARVEGGWNTFDVTRDIQSWVNNSNDNNGWAIIPWVSGDNGWGIQSSETAIVNERPQLRVFFTPVGVTVTPTSGLQTTEQGGTATFSVVLNTPPLADVTIPISSSDLSEGTTSVSSLTFTPANWDIPQVVTITGVSDGLVDGNVGYTIVTGAATTTDPNYSGINPSDVSVTNADSGSTNTAPTISNIGNQTTAFQTPTAAIPVTVFDAETPLSALTLSVTSSSNAALVPVGNIAFGGTDGNRTLVVTPANGQSGTSDIVVRVTDGAGAFSEVTFTLTVQPQQTVAPKVQTVVFGEGTQRSMVRNITVDFDSLVNINNTSGQAFTLERKLGPDWISLSAAELTINIVNSTINSGTQSRALLSFSGTQTIGGSLTDGNYRLTINSSSVTGVAGGLNLDGDGNGTGGDNFIRGTESTDNFFRLFGDMNASRSITNFDLNQMRGTNGRNNADPLFISALDANWSGSITNFDLNELRSRNGKSLSFTSGLVS